MTILGYEHIVESSKARVYFVDRPDKHKRHRILAVTVVEELQPTLRFKIPLLVEEWVVADLNGYRYIRTHVLQIEVTSPFNEI